MRKIVKTEVQSKIDMVAEQWVRLVMEHIKWKRFNQNKNKNETNNL